jgi:hypothetical protein
VIRSIIKYFITLLTAVFCITSSIDGQCFNNNFAFQVGEKISYNIAYNWHFIWINAGQVEFEVKNAKFMDRDVYHFDAWGTTFKTYDWFFKVRDNLESYLDMKSLKPLWFERKTYEGGYAVHNQYIFDHKNKRIFSFTENSNKPFTRDTLTLPPCTFDVISLSYYARNLDFNDLDVNDTIPVSAIIDNELFNLYIRYLGKEVIETKDGSRYNCIKFSALLVEGTIFKGGEDLFVWVTNDKNRIPVLVEAKILVGSVKALLINTSGLRNKVTAKLN